MLSEIALVTRTKASSVEYAVGAAGLTWGGR